MNKQEYVSYLKNIVGENDELKFTRYDESIYVIDDLWIGGGFYKGRRSVDHFALLDKDILETGVTWHDIVSWGIVIVPETKTYISDKRHPILEEKMHYQRIPLNNNHLIGFKDEQIEDEL